MTKYTYGMSANDFAEIYVGSTESDYIELISELAPRPYDPPFVWREFADTEAVRKGVIETRNGVTYTLHLESTLTVALGRPIVDMGFGFMGTEGFTFNKFEHQARVGLSGLRDIRENLLSTALYSSLHGIHIMYSVGSEDGSDETRLNIYENWFGKVGFDVTDVTSLPSFPRQLVSDYSNCFILV